MRPRAALLFLRERWAWACISPFLKSLSRSLSTPPNHLYQEIQPDLKLFFPLFLHFLHRFCPFSCSAHLWKNLDSSSSLILFPDVLSKTFHFQEASYRETDPARQHHGEFNFSEVFVHQMIHSIEFVLGAVSSQSALMETQKLERQVLGLNTKRVKELDICDEIQRVENIQFFNFPWIVPPNLNSDCN
ncbi:hypothetical protein ACLB2K_073596 [Fragaria x ananassa]